MRFETPQTIKGSPSKMPPSVSMTDRSGQASTTRRCDHRCCATSGRTPLFGPHLQRDSRSTRGSKFKLQFANGVCCGVDNSPHADLEATAAGCDTSRPQCPWPIGQDGANFGQRGETEAILPSIPGCIIRCYLSFVILQPTCCKNPHSQSAQDAPLSISVASFWSPRHFVDVILSRVACPPDCQTWHPLIHPSTRPPDVESRDDSLNPLVSGMPICSQRKTASRAWQFHRREAWSGNLFPSPWSAEGANPIVSCPFGLPT